MPRTNSGYGVEVWGSGSRGWGYCESSGSRGWAYFENTVPTLFYFEKSEVYDLRGLEGIFSRVLRVSVRVLENIVRSPGVKFNSPQLRGLFLNGVIF